MADARVSQAAVLALAGGGEARLSQAALLPLAGGAQIIFATQAAALVLANMPAAAGALRITQGLALVLAGVDGDGIRGTQNLLLVLARQVPCLTLWAQCWRIERRDGAVFRFTSHDEPVEFRGETYQPCDSLNASAAELGATLGAPGDAELVGIIADAAITARDLYAGLFDRARVEIWMVPWADAGSAVPYRITAGIAGDLSQGTEGFSVQVQTPGAQLQQQPLLPAYTPSCRWELGDARCRSIWAPWRWRARSLRRRPCGRMIRPRGACSSMRPGRNRTGTSIRAGWNGPAARTRDCRGRSRAMREGSSSCGSQ
jgi:hypothetical protein